MRVSGSRQLVGIRAALFLLCLLPLARLVWAAAHDGLGANPVEAVTRSTGWWTLSFLCLTLAVTPLRELSGAHGLLRLRRMLGLYAFFYAVLHFATYVWLDVWFDLAAVAKDIVKRPFITVGFSAFLLLLPLALTSTHRMQKRLGRNWRRLHRTVYAVGILGVLHYWWLVKRDVTEPALFALVVTALLGLRLGGNRAPGPAIASAKERSSGGPRSPAASIEN